MSSLVFLFLFISFKRDMEENKETNKKEIRTTEWYLNVMRATQELRMKRYRDVHFFVPV